MGGNISEYPHIFCNYAFGLGGGLFLESSTFHIYHGMVFGSETGAGISKNISYDQGDALYSVNSHASYGQFIGGIWNPNGYIISPFAPWFRVRDGTFAIDHGKWM